MIPRVILGEARTPSNDPLTLSREGAGVVVRVRNEVLMSSRVHGSEDALADAGCAGLRDRRRARVLVGGLGLGYTLRACLDRLASDAEIVVCELIPAIVAWNRELVGDLAGRPLEDPRVRVIEGDVLESMRPRAFDAILLDVDNGPEALTVPSNTRLYRGRGLARVAEALRPAGRLVVWSAFESPRFVKELAQVGLAHEVVRVRARGNVKKGSRHLLYVGHARGAT
jgi:spermidine synthase